MEHVGAGVARAVDVLEDAPGGHRHRGGRLAVEEGDDVAETVPVDGVGVEQVGAQRQAQVGELHAELVAAAELVHPEHRRVVLRLVLLVRTLRVAQAGDVAEAEDVGAEPRVGCQVVRMDRPERRRDDLRTLGQADPAVRAGVEQVRRREALRLGLGNPHWAQQFLERIGQHAHARCCNGGATGQLEEAAAAEGLACRTLGGHLESPVGFLGRGGCCGSPARCAPSQGSVPPLKLSTVPLTSICMPMRPPPVKAEAALRPR